MSTIVTPYGYDILLPDDETSLPALVAPAEIAAASGGRISATDPRLDALCQTVSAAIRDYCRWHVAPNLSCSCVTEVGTRVISLPAKIVTSLDSISVAGEDIDVDDVEWRRSGQIRLGRCPRHRGRWGAYEVTYHAGVDASVTPISQVAIQIALNNLVATPGVRSESVGQVSLSYNLLSDGVSGGVQLLDRDKHMLAPYKLQTLS